MHKQNKKQPGITKPVISNNDVPSPQSAVRVNSKIK